MKYSIKGMYLVLAIFISLVAIQSSFASEVSTVTGVIEEISVKPNMVVVDGTEVYGVPFNLLETYNIVLEEGDSVSFGVYEYLCSSGELRLKAYSITVGDITIVLRDVP